jgi:L-gulonolactone oxidase
VHKALWEKGLTLDTAPAVDWVTVAGAISTGSHGSGPPSISSSLISCRLVTADGEVLQVGEGDRRLDAIRISMGAFGVLSSVTLRVAPGFHVRLKRTRMPESDWKRFLTEGEMSYVQWFPQTGLACLSRVDVLDQAGATHVDADALEHAPSLTESGQLTRAGNAVLELGNNATSFFSARNRFLLDVFFQDSETSGPAHKLLMSYKSDPVAGAEWSVPVQKFEDAFAALQRLVTDERYFLPIVWLKKVKGETAWLSAADGECVQCGIYHSRIPGTRDHARDMVHRVERLMLKFAGRPHVGKLISLDPADLRAVYPNWNRFNTLRKQMDPDGMFWSNELAAAFGE